MITTYQTRLDSLIAVESTKQKRCRDILNILYEFEDGLTAREIAKLLFNRGLSATAERNQSAPRLTEMEEAGKVKVIGKRLDEISNRNVAVYVIEKEEL